MHEFLMSVFKFFRNIFYFIKILSVFVMMGLILYWVQNTAHFNWTWLNFMKPTLEGFLSAGNALCPLKFDLFGATFELKYLSALFLLVMIAVGMNFLNLGVNLIESFYLGSRLLLRKNEETELNRVLKSEMTRKQKRLHKFFVVINTYEKERSIYDRSQKVDMNEQNTIMNDFLMEKTGITPEKFEGGFMYTFNSFDGIDQVLDILFKVINSKAPIDYTICIQIARESLEIEKENLKNLVKLKYLGKIYMGSETAYRYSYNKYNHYVTSQIGVYQVGKDTIEVHEFREKL